MAISSVLPAAGGGLLQPAGRTGGPVRSAVRLRRLPRHSPRADFDGAPGPGLPFHGISSYIDGRAGRKPMDDAALKKLVDLFPPSCVFDGEGRVLFDSGATRHIAAIVIEPARDARAAAGAKVTIRCKRPRPFPPLLSVVDICGVAISVECVGKSDWVFTLEFGRGSSGPSLGRESPGLYCVEIR